MIEFLIACSPAISLPGMGPPPTTNCGPGDIKLVEDVGDVEEKGRDAKIPTQQITYF